MSAQVIQLLLVEDNPGDVFIIQDMLQQIRAPKLKLTHVERLDDAIAHLGHGSINRAFDGALLDLSLPDSHGLDTLLSLQARSPTLPIVILTGTDNEDLAMQAMRQGAQDYLVKGQVGKDALVHSVRYAIARKKIELDLKQRTLDLEVANQTLNQRSAQLEVANQELEKRTAQLEVANQELETFSYTVSHDLANPLTVIMGFTSMLELQYSQQLGAKGKHYVVGIEKAAQRMNQLIQDLLQMSKMTRSEVQLESVNLSVLVQEILLTMQESQTHRAVETVIHPELVAQGDANLLSVVLENLLGNAWKYTSKQENARIEFGAVFSASAGCISPQPLPQKQQVYFVRDNGAGFDMQKASNLFKPFQRLHEKTEFEGTGIGLATVQRIINRHGGKIWAEAAIDQGATFYFTLPQS